MLADGKGRATCENENTHMAKTNKCVTVERALFLESKCLHGGLVFFSHFGLKEVICINQTQCLSAMCVLRQTMKELNPYFAILFEFRHYSEFTYVL